MSERERILERIRQGRGRPGAPPPPRRPTPSSAIGDPQDLLPELIEMAAIRGTTVARVPDLSRLPREVADHLRSIDRPLTLRTARDPELSTLDWVGSGIEASAIGDEPDDRAATLTRALCAVAETGTFVHASGAQTPAFLAFTGFAHFAVVDLERLVPRMEDALALARSRGLPRMLSFIAGVSATGDFGSVAVRPGQGPGSVRLVVVG